MKISSAIASFFVFILLSSVAGASLPFDIEGVENFAMGGVGTAIDSPRAPLYNPALLALREKFHLTAIDIPITISHDIVKAGVFIYENMEAFGDFENLSEDMQEDIVDLAAYDLRINLGLVSPNFSAGPYAVYTGARWWDMWWGLGVYNENYIKINVNKGIFIPKVDLDVRADGIIHLPVGIRMRYLPWGIPGKIYAGAAVKYLMRTKVKESRSIMEIKDVMEEFENKDLSPGTGLGFDLGMHYAISPKWNFAFAVKDLLGTTISYPEDEDEEISARADIGASYQLSRKLQLAADFRDIKFNDFNRPAFFTKLHLGAQFNLTGVFKLRGGLYQGYPTFGLGVGSAVNYAFYGKEEGSYPGDDPIYLHTLAFALRF